MSKIREAIEKLGIPIAPAGHRHGRPGWVQIECPFCTLGGAPKFHMGVNEVRPRASCWKCGPHRLADSLSKASRKPLEQVRQVLRPLGLKTQPQMRLEALTEGVLKIPKGLGPLKSAHSTYLRGRGLDPDEMVALWGLGGLGLTAGRMAGRIFIPVVYQGETVSWTTRSISPTSTRRYHSAKAEEEKLPHKQLLYGEDYCVGATVVVFEGPPDVWKFGKGGTATMGTSYSPQQVARLSKYGRRFICFDMEKDAQRRAEALAHELAPFDGMTEIVTWNGPKDVGDMNDQQVRKLRKYIGI